MVQNETHYNSLAQLHRHRASGLGGTSSGGVATYAIATLPNTRFRLLEALEGIGRLPERQISAPR